MENTYTFEEKINYAKEAILKHVPAKYIYLFGSHAYGNPKKDSDIDIYAVIPDEVKFDTFTHVDIKCELFDRRILDIDLHLASESKFNTQRLLRSFYETIYEKGIIIYEST